MFLFDELSDVYQQLQAYEQKIFGSIENSSIAMPNLSPSSLGSFSFGFSRPNDPPVPVPVFSNIGGASIFSRPQFDIPPQEFTFGAGPPQRNTSDDASFKTNTNTPAVNDITMDGS
ncbi:UNVERIFIED_CONTAM: Protein-tyrosine-phosphatase IBR5 [Sesamum radiatum]|uniref:Protein-tyrosine-phosphatase IBR5 n=1 Tax=Sesamum radiatum TaxID=300843 RepID=A0AAW2LNF4_SESRA